VQWGSLWPCGQRCVWPEITEHADSRPPTLATQSRELLLFRGFRQHNRHHPCLLIYPSQMSSICVQDTSPSALRHLNESSRTGTSLDHFPFHRCVHHSYLLFPSGLIFPYWLVTFVHVHAACTHLNLVYLYQPIVIGEAFRLFVILLLLALPCLNSLTRCVITCPIWLNNPRQRGLEVFMNLSQPRFSPQAAAILTSSGFFLPYRFHKW
jgi:hypothetical protein